MLLCLSSVSKGADSAEERGYKILTESPVLSSDFNEQTFVQIWRSWPKELQLATKDLSQQQRRMIAFERYGLTTRPDDNSNQPLQYVVSEDGKWTMNCFACHGGLVNGKPFPGAPNNKIGLQTLTEEIRETKFRVGAALSRMDIGALLIPLGTTHGTTNAVVFGMGLMNQRDTELNYTPAAPRQFVHHDMDAPPWWYFYKRDRLYIDGFAQKGHRGLMQFMLIPENGPDFFRKHEDDFRDVYAYISSLRPPRYPRDINAELADAGRILFNAHCSECHGTYGDDWTYPNLRIPIDQIKTDPVRLQALSSEGRNKYANSWFAHAGESNQQVTIVEPDGYVAPPLDGAWASAPYFHNGSVPTIRGVLRSAERPSIWKRKSDSINEDEIGLIYEAVRAIPTNETDVARRRSYFDTKVNGKSNQGHTFGDSLSEKELLQVLEYLKTL